jgi:outer membrane protein assembly factor BamB
MKNAKTMGVLVGCVMLLGANCVRAQDWPQWRGPNRDNKVIGFTEPKTWPKELTKKWSTKVGIGDASPVLVGDKIYVFTREGGDEVIQCLDAGKGTEVWKDKYAAEAVTGAGAGGGARAGTRSSPAVADGKVCTFGVGGTLSCYDADKGKLSWRKETKAWPQFFTSVSPIIVDGKCIAFIGGNGRGSAKGVDAIVAYDLASGDEKWKWTGAGPAYGSPVLMTVDKTKMLVTLTSSGLVGISAADGKELWKTAYKSRYNSETPIVDGQTVYCSGAGTVAFKIEKKDDGFTPNQLWKKTEAAGIYNTPVLKDGMLYGLTGTQQATSLFCVNAESGEVVWTDSTKRGGCGAVLDAGTVLLALTSNGELLAFKPSNKGYEELAKYKVGDAPWAYPIIAGNRVFVKDKDSVTLWLIE